ncbi:DUF4878 domain-containing protein [archaeon]|nr:DUF4878 domain-containing protein [archaeon]
MRKMLFAVFAVLLVSACVQQYPQKPSEVVKAFLEATISLDFDKATNFASLELKPQVEAAAAQARQRLGNMSSVVGFLLKSQITDFSVISEDVTGDTATVRFTYSFSVTFMNTTQQSPTLTGEASLIKENGQWKLNTPITPGAGGSDSGDTIIPANAQPSAVTRLFFEKVVKGNVQASEALAAESYKQNISSMVQNYNAAGATGNVTEFTVVEEEVDEEDETATVIFTARTSVYFLGNVSESYGQYSVGLVKEDGEWRVSDFHSENS